MLRRFTVDIGLSVRRFGVGDGFVKPDAPAYTFHAQTAPVDHLLFGHGLMAEDRGEGRSGAIVMSARSLVPFSTEL